MIDPRSPNYASTPIAPDRARFEYAPAAAARMEHRVAPAAAIVTPFFNTGEIFHETAACVLGFDARHPEVRRASGQSLQNFEWIIVNDASTSPEALRVLDMYRELSAADPRIRIIDHAKNHGLPAARNTGWRAARAPYVLFLDSDDLIEPTTLEKSVLDLECNPMFAFVKGWTVGFGSDSYLWSRGFHNREKMLGQNLVTATTAVRTSLLETVGGFDETIRGGMEDWEFWLRCAALGHWGETIPEYLDWYRRRERQHDAWDNLSQPDRTGRFSELVRARLGQEGERVFAGEFPCPGRDVWIDMPFAHPAMPLDEPAPGRDVLVNLLKKDRRRLLLIVPWLRLGGADRFNLDLVRCLTSDAGWEVTVVAVHPDNPWLPAFAALTPDVFALSHLSTPHHAPRIISHLIGSRNPDVVMVTNSQLGYWLLPWLRGRHPDTTFVDLNHMEEPEWRNGGHPRTGAGFQEHLDASIVVSEHLKRWMCLPPRNADPQRVEVCRIHVDAGRYAPDALGRAEWRDRLKIDARTPVILYAARLTAQKQPLVFGRTMELLRERDPGFIALVAGHGELGGALNDFVRMRGLESHVHFLGEVPPPQMPSLMGAADIFFLPSQWEGIALTLYEAMAAGLTVVGADVGGQAELVTPETGILLSFPKRGEELEAQAYAATLASVLVDPARREAMGVAARERIIRHFGFDVMGRRILDIFERAHQWRRERPRQIVSEGFARELVLQGVEMMRVHELADDLWGYRQRWLDSASEAAMAATRRDAEAAVALEQLANSRTWKTIEAIKGTPPYAMLARARFGPDWRLIDPKEPPHVRLARIHASRAYRLVRAIEGWTGKEERKA